MGYPESNEIMSKAQMARLIAVINGDDQPADLYPAYNELPSKEQGEELIESVEDFISEHGGGDLPTVTADDNGKALIVVNGVWVVGAIEHPIPTVTASDNGKAIIVANGELTVGEIAHPKGAAVADAVGDAPTAAEFKALLDSLRAADLIATT